MIENYKNNKKNTTKNHQFLGAFAKLWRATISFIVSVHPSLWSNSAPTGQFLIMKFDIWRFFETLLRQLKCH